VYVGLFGGFVGGFAIVMASKILFGWKLAFGVESAVVIGSSFGGTLLGAVLGGVVVNRFHRWWQGPGTPTYEQDRTPSSVRALPTSQTPLHRMPTWFAWIWGSLFLIIGSVFLYVLLIQPVWGMVEASGWEETPCTILTSKLEKHWGENGESFRIAISYEYDFHGKTLRSDRYDFVVLTSNTNVEHRQAIVKDHPPGKRTRCYVNPANPTEAVLNRGWTSEMWWGLFPLPFVLVGAGGLFYAVRIRRRKENAPESVALVPR
jgi:hypothetical protein